MLKRKLWTRPLILLAMLTLTWAAEAQVQPPPTPVPRRTPVPVRPTAAPSSEAPTRRTPTMNRSAGSRSTRSSATRSVSHGTRRAPSSRGGSTLGEGTLNISIDRNQPVLMIRPGSMNVKPDDIAEFAVVLSNPQKQLIDELHVVLKYDPAYLELIEIDDEELRNVAGVNSEIHSGPLDKGLFEYSILMENPLSVALANIIKIKVRARQAIPGTPLGFGRFGVLQTSVRQNGNSLMEIGEGLFTKGCIGARVSIVPQPEEKEESSLRTWITDDQWEAEVLNSARDAEGNQQTVALALHPEQTTLAAGEETQIQLLFENDSQLPVDHFDIRLRFDPELLEVLDYDKGNYMRNDINLHDGDKHLDFPFNIHLANKVDNRRGTIHYEMAASDAAALSTHGRIATIHVRALKPADFAPVWFDRDTGGAMSSSITSFGVNLLVDHESGQAQVRSTRLEIFEPQAIDTTPRQEAHAVE